MSGTEKDVLCNIEGAEDVILGTANTVSNAEHSLEGLAATVFDDTDIDPSRPGNTEDPLLQHQMESPNINSGDVRLQGTPNQVPYFLNLVSNRALPHFSSQKLSRGTNGSKIKC